VEQRAIVRHKRGEPPLPRDRKLIREPHHLVRQRADKSIAARHELDGGKFLEVGMVGHEVQSPLWGEISRAQGLPEPCPAEPFHRWGGGGAMLEPAQRPARVVEAEVLEGKLLIPCRSGAGQSPVRDTGESRQSLMQGP